MSRIEIRIDELVLRGIRPEQARELEVGIGEGLCDLARSTQVESLRSHHVVHARPGQVPADERPLGRAVAEQIWRFVTAGPEQDGQP